VDNKQVDGVPTAPNVPATLQQMFRWSLYRHKYNPRRRKFDKIPLAPNGPAGANLSTAEIASWVSFDDAYAAWASGLHGAFASGMCALVTLPIQELADQESVKAVVFDLDYCRDKDTGVLAPWAVALLQRLNTYAEVSPGGEGVHIIFQLRGPVRDDWVWRQTAEDGSTPQSGPGIEAYHGKTARHITITGKVLDGYGDVREIECELLDDIEAAYKTAGVRTKPKHEPLPAELPEPVDVASLDMRESAADFLLYGADDSDSVDRSRLLFAATLSLALAGVSKDQAFATLCSLPHVMDMATSHWPGSVERQHEYLWRHQVLKAYDKAARISVQPDEFEIEDAVTSGARADAADGAPSASAPGSVTASADDFADISAAGQPEILAKTPQKKPLFDIVPASVFTERRAPTQWIVRGVLPKADVSAMYGASGSGKSFICLSMMLNVALGREWAGCKVQRSKVLYIAAEGAKSFWMRVVAWCMRHEVKVTDLDGWFYVLGDSPNLHGERTDTKRLAESVQERCPQGIDVIVVDTASQVTMGANENSSEDMGGYLHRLRQLGALLGCHVLNIGHSGKDTDKDMRGWSGMWAAMDSVVEVVRTKEYRSLVVRKLKDGTGEGAEYQFALDNVVLDYDVDDGEISSCAARHLATLEVSNARMKAKAEMSAAAGVAREAAKQQGATDKQPSPRQAFVLERLRHYADKQGPRMPLAAIKKLLCQDLETCAEDGVGMTAKAVVTRQTGDALQRVLKFWEAKGTVTIDEQNLHFTENQLF